MAGRLLDVTASTTLDHVQGSVRGADWTDEGVGVLDVYTPRDDPDAVVLAFELDPADQAHVDQHMDRLRLSPDRARDLAAALESAAGETRDVTRPRRLGD
ncbi:DUF6360 family protein [Halorhabdus sp. BNX81]|uniref:DUF6360 family protein n=1 Tax=Halorhabdus sp. BNX81 TaxID=2980181 RepID=UPI0023DD48E3|nr:DUF6360 family protein [Halorhabdus sp. BNX81]